VSRAGPDQADDILGEKQWNNSFVMKIAAFLAISGFVTGYDIGTVSVIGLYLIDPNNKNTGLSVNQVNLFIAIG
jgi:hypothetical protein